MKADAKWLEYIPRSILLLITGVSSLITVYRDIWWLEKVVFVFSCICATSLFLLIWYKLRRDFVLTVGRIDLLLLLFYTYIFITTIAVKNVEISDIKIYTFLSLLTYYIICRIILHNRDLLAFYLGSLFFVILINSVYGILQYVGIFPSYSAFFRITGTFLNPGIYGGFIAMGVPLALWRVRNSLHARPILLLNLVCLATIILSLILSESRAGILSAIISVTVFTYYFSKKKNLVSKSVMIYTAIGISVLCFCLAIVNLESILGRILVWRISLRMFFECPSIGHGYGQFPIQYGFNQAKFFELNESSTALKQIAGMNYYPFNEFLRILVENGVIGFFVFVIILYKTVLSLASSALNDQTAPIKIILSVLAGILTFAQFSYPFDNLALTMVFYSILAIAAAYDKHYEIQIGFVLKRILISTILILTTAGLFSSMQKIVAIYRWENAQKYLMFREQDSWDIYEAVYPRLSNNSTFLFNYGAELISFERYKKGIIILNQAKKYTNNVDVHLVLGDSYFAIGQTLMSEEEYKIANNMVPNLFKPLEKLLDLYLSINDIKKANLTANKILRQPIKVPSKEVLDIKARARKILIIKK